LIQAITGIDLPLVWAVLILFSVMMYVIMDGFDLGIGLLFPFVPGEDDRDVMMNTIAPVWDGNETWLVLGGAGLLAAVPLAYSLVLTAFYLPIIVMLIGLIFRGVAFEFRLKSTQGQRQLWNHAFAGGSTVATFFQGVTLGGFIQGLPLETATYGGSTLGWITPFALFTGCALVIAYSLLGATWLIMKTDGPLQARMRRIAGKLTSALLIVIAVISVWTPLANADISARWFSFPNLLWFSPVPILVVAAAAKLFRSLRRDSDARPFLLTLALVFLAYGGLGISLWPHVVPPHLTIWDAAGPPQSLEFTLVGALAIIPMILMYNAWSYWVFRGKVRVGDEYH